MNISFIEVPNYPERRNLYVFFGMSSPTDSLADDTRRFFTGLFICSQPLAEALWQFGLHGFSPLKIIQIQTLVSINRNLTESC